MLSTIGQVALLFAKISYKKFQFNKGLWWNSIRNVFPYIQNIRTYYIDIVCYVHSQSYFYLQTCQIYTVPHYTVRYSVPEQLPGGHKIFFNAGFEPAAIRAKTQTFSHCANFVIKTRMQS